MTESQALDEILDKHGWAYDLDQLEVLEQDLLKLLKEARRNTLTKVGEPKLGDFDIKPESYDDVIKAIQWYKKRLEELSK